MLRGEAVTAWYFEVIRGAEVERASPPQQWGRKIGRRKSCIKRNLQKSEGREKER